MVEVLIDKVVCYLEVDLFIICKCNFYGESIGIVMLYGMEVEYNLLFEIMIKLEIDGYYWVCRKVIMVFNCNSLVIKKGLVLIFVKFGILFIVKYFN